MSATKHFYKGTTKDFIIFVDDEEAASEYVKDSTVPISDAVGLFKVFTTESGRGSEGKLESASQQDLENEFGSDKSVEYIVDFIIKNGTNKSGANVERKSFNSTNDANSGH
jgi:ribosome maturation protein Sdo1